MTAARARPGPVRGVQPFETSDPACPNLFDQACARGIGVIGATIHDVAQVVGAGFSVSDEAGELATLVELFRVAMLPVVLVAIVLVLRATGTAGAESRVTLFPWFMILFLLLMIGGSLVDIPALIVAQVELVSRACLITAIAALGIKTSLKAVSEVGGGHLVVVVVETLVLLALAVAALRVLDLV